MEYREILKAFAEKLGGHAEILPDENGTVSLDIDDMPVMILGLEEIGLLAITGVIGEPPPEDRMERLYKALLEANHNFVGTRGATLSIDPDSGNVMLCKTLPLAATDGDSFFAEVERFVNTLEVWRKIVSDFRGAEIEPQGPRAENTPAGAPSESEGGDLAGFMQV